MARKRSVHRPRRVLYAYEVLEPRTLLSTVPAAGNTVEIKGTPGNDVITLSSHTDRLGIHQFVESTADPPRVSASYLPTASLSIPARAQTR